MINLMLGDCLEQLKTLPNDSVDSIVTDPPYGIGFMNKNWDKAVPPAEVWAECLRVLKPGGHLLAFAGTRTQHRMATNIEDAGFEIRDMIAWVYGSGFPKSMDVSKAIDKAAGAVRKGTGQMVRGGCRAARGGAELVGSQSVEEAKWKEITVPATPEAEQWEGWGTALKPALEPITVARKPFKGTVANNVLNHGTGAFNIDASRIETTGTDSQGRFPANLIHDGSEEVVSLFPENAGAAAPVRGTENSDTTKDIYNKRARVKGAYHNDKGSAARFFYCAKVSKRDRNEGLPEGLENKHVTVKPTDLMRYLCRLVTPPGGIVLDPFMGSGSHGKAAILEGFGFIGIELDEGSYEVATHRILTAKEAAC